MTSLNMPVGWLASMALRTGLTAMGLSGRRRNFVGTPAVVAPLPVQVTRGGGGFLDVVPRIIHIEPVKILLEDRLLVTTRERVESPPEVFTEPIKILLFDQMRIVTDEQVIDGADRRRGKRIALRWFGLNDPTEDTDPFGVLGD